MVTASVAPSRVKMPLSSSLPLTSTSLETVEVGKQEHKEQYYKVLFKKGSNEMRIIRGYNKHPTRVSGRRNGVDSPLAEHRRQALGHVVAGVERLGEKRKWGGGIRKKK